MIDWKEWKDGTPLEFGKLYVFCYGEDDYGIWPCDGGWRPSCKVYHYAEIAPPPRPHEPCMRPGCCGRGFEEVITTVNYRICCDLCSIRTGLYPTAADAWADWDKRGER
jgi:hypothetical protein